METRTRLSTGIVLAALLATPALGRAADAAAGYHITPSGYRMPVFGSFGGGSGPVCRRLTSGEIESRDLVRLRRVRSQAARPSATVTSTTAQGLVFNVI